ncbi:MAG: transglycosylase SLT domain-containing protein [Oscillatoriales cyanobacterium SM2_2_1]|nr:transglycosylase SLT domain-containing protein [Oscillatoriales cyanobacterium SM2_2_1]
MASKRLGLWLLGGSGALLSIVGTFAGAGGEWRSPLNQAIEPRDPIASAVAQGVAKPGRDSLPLLVQAESLLRASRPREALQVLSGEAPQGLMAYWVLKRAQALTMANDRVAASAAWQELIQRFPQHPVAAEAHFVLGQYSALLQRFPSHLRSQEVVLRGLAQEPRRVDLLTHLAVYFGDRRDIVPYLDRLVAAKPNLTPEQWWAVGDAYYFRMADRQAVVAYSRATQNAVVLYRLGRVLQALNQRDRAIAVYGAVVQRFSTSPEAPRALVRITQIGSPSQGLAAADRLIANYADTTAEGVLIKADLLARQQSRAAQDNYQLLLNRYGTSNAAAQYRWRLARQRAERGDRSGAIALVQQIQQLGPAHSVSAEANFWAGRWAQQMGASQRARQHHEFVLRQHPDSYFAWRSASAMGWPVGDLSSVRQVNAPLSPQLNRSSLPAGSAEVQALFTLGLDREAFNHWQVEKGARRLLTVSEIFTDGVLRVRVGDTLVGIRQLESLNWIDVSAAERALIPQLRRQPLYWQSLYPLPFWELISPASQQQKLPPALVMGLIRQESRFEATIRSVAGATGLMQVMPDTGTYIAGRIGVKQFNLNSPSDNIRFGTWYLNYTHQQLQNNSMLAIASYNAGPGAVGRWVRQRGASDPDAFIRSIPYTETRDYVERVFENYWNYLRLYAPSIRQRLATLGG